MNIKNNRPNSNGKYKQGYFKPNNAFKYKGDATQIIYRSSWELKVMSALDQSPNIEWWGSEILKVPYFFPSPAGDDKMHEYYPDIIFKTYDTEDSPGIVYVCEVKPTSQLKKPDVPKTKSAKTLKRYSDAMVVFARNFFKAQAARELCSRHQNWKYVFITEESNIKNLPI